MLSNSKKDITLIYGIIYVMKQNLLECHHNHNINIYCYPSDYIDYKL